MLKGKSAIQANGTSPKTKIRSSPRKSGLTQNKSKYMIVDWLNNIDTKKDFSDKFNHSTIPIHP